MFGLFQNLCFLLLYCISNLNTIFSFVKCDILKKWNNDCQPLRLFFKCCCKNGEKVELVSSFRKIILCCFIRTNVLIKKNYLHGPKNNSLLPLFLKFFFLREK